MVVKFYSKAINTGLRKQGLKHTVKDVPVFITLKEGLDLNYCFIEDETKEVLIVAETTKHGTEEIRTINKDSIIYIGVIYQDLNSKKENKTTNDVMYN